jgi:hydroxymethylglutaryl-CoA lyase
MREGMQIESVEISVPDRLRLLDALSGVGLDSINVGSFVSPRYTPQMACIDELLSQFTPRPGQTYTALALNARGRERAAAYPWISAVISTPTLTCHLCDTFVRRNANRTQAEEIGQWPVIAEAAVAHGVTEAGIGLNAAWGSNFEGKFSLDGRLAVLRRAHAVWDEHGVAVTSLMLGDPMSWCMPNEVEETLTAALGLWPEIRTVRLHLHDARGMALPSSYAALRCLSELDGDGDEPVHLHLDTTAGGIGGCPYCGNGRATGMAATEDVVAMLEAMGIKTGVDLDALIGVTWMLEEILGRPVPGHVAHAGGRPDGSRLYDPNLPLVETHEEARHFRLGPAAAEHQRRPWREAIPDPGTRRAAAGSGVGVTA